MVETPTADPTVTIVEPVKTEITQPSTTTETKPAPTTEVKPETKVEAKPEPKKGEKSLLNEDDKVAQGAPEKYEPWTLPEGFEIPEETAKEVDATFKELGISQEAGQKLVDFYAKQAQAALTAPYEAYAEMRKSWRDSVAADPEIGKILPQVKQTISRALDGLNNPKLVAEFKEAMDFSGAGDHPAFIKAFYQLAQKAVEGKHVSGSGPAKTGQTAPNARPPSMAEALYPNGPSTKQGNS